MSIVLRDIWRNEWYRPEEGASLAEIKRHIIKYGYIGAESGYYAHEHEIDLGECGEFVKSYNRTRSASYLDEEKNCKDFNEKRIHLYFELYGY